MTGFIKLMTAVVLLTIPAMASAQRNLGLGAPYYGRYSEFGPYEGADLYGGFDGELGEDDWYYDHYDLGYGYDDWYVDYYLDTQDVATIEARDDRDDLDDIEDRGDIAKDRANLLDDLDDDPPRYWDVDWDIYDDEDLYDGGIYDGYGFD